MDEAERLTRYIADDAERWYAVHARLNALALATYAMGLPMAADPERLRGVIRVLQMGLQPGSDASPPHPAFATELRKLIEGWKEALRPYPVEAPRPDATPTAEG